MKVLRLGAVVRVLGALGGYFGRDKLVWSEY